MELTNKHFYFKIILFVLICFYSIKCSKKQNYSSDCLLSDIKIDEKLFLSFSEKENQDCAFSLTSSYSYFEVDSTAKLLIEGEDVFINLSGKENVYEKFFSLNQKIGEKRKIQIKNRDWKGGNGFNFVTRDYNIEIINKLELENEVILFISIIDFIYSLEIDRSYDAVVIFSSKNGFIGSYTVDNLEKVILSQRGEIFDKIVDYSNFEFGLLE